MSFRRLSLFWKIWLSTSVALTAILMITGLLLQSNVLDMTFRSLEEEANASFQAYESVWKTRAEALGSVAAILSSMPNVRAAFGTHDQATIQDSAGEVWAKVSDDLRETAFFQVTDPNGNTVASLDSEVRAKVPRTWPIVRTVRASFPKQAAGFFVRDGDLYQLVLTPVYVDAAGGPALINVLVAGYSVNHDVVQRLKASTGGSEFVFEAGGKVFASTLNDRATNVLIGSLQSPPSRSVVSDGVSEYLPLVKDLIGMDGKPAGRVGIFRSFEGARQRVADLRRTVVLIWLAATALGLALTWLLARRIVQPVKELDRAAAEVGRQNYDYRVSVVSEDELGRLASTFNSMCSNLQLARAELIRQERISTIGRLASSMVHDLRNPLAAIYGGSEMMVDTDLTETQMKRVAGNIYRASRRIQDMLQALVNVSRSKAGGTELCRLREVVMAAVDSVSAAAEQQHVRIHVDLSEQIEVPLERARIERVFLNLLDNALEVMPEGGEIRIAARVLEDAVLVEVQDSGPGVSKEIRDQLFQPFVTYGKKTGMGLGLALSRQTVLDHGGEMWVAESQAGAKFCLRLPLAPAGILK
jgi:signal transduction histidine kinase